MSAKNRSRCNICHEEADLLVRYKGKTLCVHHLILKDTAAAFQLAAYLRDFWGLNPSPPGQPAPPSETYPLLYPPPLPQKSPSA